MSHQLAKELVSLGHEVDTLTMSYRGSVRYEEQDGVHIYRVPSIRIRKGMCQTHEMLLYDLSAMLFAFKFHRKKKYDICHTHFIIPTGLVALLLKRLTGLPYIITAHGSDIPGHNPIKFSTQHSLIKPIWKAVARDAEMIVSPSNDLKRTIHFTDPSLRVEVISNGFHPEKFTPRENKEHIILMVGRLLKFKGYQYVLQALKDIDTKGYRIFIAGDGTYRPHLERIADELHEDRVSFLGWVHPQKLQELYERSSIFILASECESFGLVLLEAMSAGCAVISTAIETCSEVVGDAAITVQPRDVDGLGRAIASLVSNPERVREMSKKGRERVARYFHWNNIALKYETLLSSIIAETQVLLVKEK